MYENNQRTKFVCAKCKKIFESDPNWTEEMKESRFIRQYKKEINKPVAMVCDICYNEIMQLKLLKKGEELLKKHPELGFI